MTFQPLVPLAGYAGWTFLQRTLESQTEAFSRAPLNSRDIAYFKENIGQVVSASELVQDFQLLRVALGAYGLQEDIQNKAFIERVLADGTSDDDALSNRLADKRYRAFSEAFGFGEAAIPKTLTAGFADKILARFERQEFERAVGEQNENMRFALTLTRELPEIVEQGFDTDTTWLTVMGNPPLRNVFETAFGLPSTIGLLDLDRQLEVFKERSQRLYGTENPADLATPEVMDDVVKSYLGRAQINQFVQAATPASIALTLLQNA